MTPGYRPRGLQGKVNRAENVRPIEDAPGVTLGMVGENAGGRLKPELQRSRLKPGLQRGGDCRFSRLDLAASNFAGSAAIAENLIRIFKNLEN